MACASGRNREGEVVRDGRAAAWARGFDRKVAGIKTAGLELVTDNGASAGW